MAGGVKSLPLKGKADKRDSVNNNSSLLTPNS